MGQNTGDRPFPRVRGPYELTAIESLDGAAQSRRGRTQYAEGVKLTHTSSIVAGLMTTSNRDTLRQRIEHGLENLAVLLAEDGARLHVLAIDDEAPSVDLALVLDSVECEDCVLPPERLRATVAASLHRDIGAPIAVTIADPREPPDAHVTPTATTNGVSGALLEVLDPTGVAPDDGPLDPGPDAGSLRGRAIVIRHDVLWPSFDWTVEEWTALLENAGATVQRWARAQGVKDDVLARDDAEYESLLAGADVVISGLANCGSCTSWSVRDALLAASRGLPTTVIATAHFEQLARLLAAEGGRPGMRVTVLPYPYSTLDEATVRGHARKEFAQLVDVLGASV